MSFSATLFLILFRHDLSLNLEFAFSARLAANKPSGPAVFASPQCWDYRHAWDQTHFSRGAGIQTLTLMLVLCFNYRTISPALYLFIKKNKNCSVVLENCGFCIPGKELTWLKMLNIIKH